MQASVAPDMSRSSLEPQDQEGAVPRKSFGRKRPAESEFVGRSGRRALYNPTMPYDGARPTTKPLQHTSSHGRPISSNNGPQVNRASERQPGLIELQKYDPRYPGLLLQPDSRPISQEQLASEVKSIYAGLTMVETKCIHVDRAAAFPTGEPGKKLAADHWQALIALHRTLLHEHHDFFLASQHPSASPALKRLAAKYSMPARMWKHGIHSFLELLRQRLPESIDYMLAFIYLAYQMMALLYETVPAFEDTWIECLGDLGRYRMVVEDEDTRDRETWAGVARSWYSNANAADKTLSRGRLYHHLAILATTGPLQQLHYYARSLTCGKPRLRYYHESIRSLSNPKVVEGQSPCPPPCETLPRDYILHGLLWREAIQPSPYLEHRCSEHETGFRTFFKHVYTSLRFFISRLNKEAHILATLACLTRLPKAAASSDAGTTTDPIFGEDTPFDYIMYALMLLYLLVVWYVSPRAKAYAFAIMLAMAVLWPALISDAFSAGIRKTAFKIWTVTTFHYVAEDCVDAIDPKLHVIQFLVLSVLLEIVGAALQSFSAASLLVALPPSLAAAAVINWALPQAPRPHRGADEEDQRRHFDDANDRVPGDNHPTHDARSSSNRANMIPTRDTLPDPEAFAIGDQSDLESLQATPNRI